MATPDPLPAPDVPDRSPWEAAAATVRVIARLAPDLADADAVWDAFATWKGPAARTWVDAIRRTRHVLVTSLLQDLYAFGRTRVPAAAGPGLCTTVGREFAAGVFADTVRPLLQVAIEESGPLQARVVAVVRQWLDRQAGDVYALDAEAGPEGIACTLRYADPAAVRARDAAVGVDTDASFRNSADFITGAVAAFCEKAVEGCDASGVAPVLDARGARFRLPVGAGARFAYETLCATLAGHLRLVEARAREAAEAERAEQDLVLGCTAMHETWERLRRASRTEEIVLLRGESGTGKSFLARKIHDLSPRRERPFVEVALTADVGADARVQADLFGHERGAFTGATEQKRGLFDLADGGTIFLDEVGDASSEVQARLLRVIESGGFRRLGGTQDRRVDVRVIAATNRDLERAVATGGFRQDLYYRLNVIPITLPPLRARRASIPALAEALLARAAARGKPRRRLAPGLADRLALHDWPGNVRELDHALKYAAAMCDGETMHEHDLPESLRGAPAGAASPTLAAGPPTTRPGDGTPVDGAALRAAIRAALTAPPVDGPSHACAAHVDFGRRAWLTALIDETDGDLAVIGRLWDRGSEKTLRKVVREFGLAEHLAAARVRTRPGA